MNLRIDKQFIKKKKQNIKRNNEKRKIKDNRKNKKKI